MGQKGLYWWSEEVCLEQGPTPPMDMSLGELQRLVIDGGGLACRGQWGLTVGPQLKQLN